MAYPSENATPLLSTLPGGLLNYSWGIGGNFVGSADFVRWKIYSVLVHDIQSIRNVADTAVWETLARHGPKPLLPSITALNSHDLVGGWLPFNSYKGIFFTSTLSQFDLRVIDPDRELTKAIDVLFECSPNLTALRVSWNYRSLRCAVRLDRPPRTALSESLRAFAHLRELSISSIHILPAALSYIGALPSLQTLSIQVSSDDYPALWTAFSFVEGGVHFPQLRSLSIIADDLSWVIDLLQTISSSSVARVRVSSTGRCGQARFEKFCETLARHPSRASLRRIQHTGWLGVSCDLNAAFASLLTLPAITEITLSTTSIVMLSDDTLEAISRAWPQLERLDLHQYHYNPEAAFEDYFSPLEYRATLRGLYALARNCPCLRVITLPLFPWCDALHKVHDARTPGWEQDFLPVSPGRSSLTRLYVGFFDTLDPARVAGILSAIFPHLDMVTHGDDRDIYSFSGWREVNRVLKAFSRIRAQERSRSSERERR